MNSSTIQSEFDVLRDFLLSGNRCLATSGLAFHGLTGNLHYQSLPDLETLDQAIASLRPDCLIVEFPGDGGSGMLPLLDTVHLVRSARVRICLVTHFSLADFRIRPCPDLLVCGLKSEKIRIYTPDMEITEESAAETDARRRQAAAAMTLVRELSNAGIPFRYPGWPTDLLHKRARRMLCGYGKRIWIPAELAHKGSDRWQLVAETREDYLPVEPIIVDVKDEVG